LFAIFEESTALSLWLSTSPSCGQNDWDCVF